MSERHIPLCSTKGCPHPSDPDWHRCFIDGCNKQEGDHQHFPKKSLAGKGAKIVAFLCRNHHEKITLHQWREGVYTHPDGSKRYYVQNQKGEEQCERVIEAAPEQASSPQEQVGDSSRLKHMLAQPLGAPIELTDEEAEEIVRLAAGSRPDLTPGKEYVEDVRSDEPREGLPAVTAVTDSAKASIKGRQALEPSRTSLPAVKEEALPVAWEALSDEELAAIYADADKNQKDAFLTKCHAIHTYRERHVQQWGESWTDQAYELFDGAPSRRTLGAYANIWGICDTSGPNLEHIGPLTDSRALMQNIGRRKPEDGKVALEAAVAHLAEFGEPPTVAALQHRLGEEREKPVDVCPKYGDKHRFFCACGKER